MTPAELRQKRAERLKEARGVYDKIKSENRDPTPDETILVDAMLAEADGFEAKALGAEQWATIDTRLTEGTKSLGRVTDPLPHEDPLNTHGRHQYSMMKALQEAAGWGETKRAYGLTGLEAEVAAELRKKRHDMGLGAPKGVLMPNNLPVDIRASYRFAAAAGIKLEKYDLDTSAGAGSIPTILSANMIDILRARMVTVGMGAQTMENMQGLFAIPRQATAATFSWVTQGQSVTKTNQTIDQVPFSPHTGGAQTQYTRQFLEQTNQSAEQFVRSDQAAVIARGIETAGLNGTGSSGQPLGLLQNSLIPIVAAGGNGAAPSWTNVVQLETAIATANADMGSLGYVTDAAMRGTMKTTAKIGSTFPIYLWNMDSPSTPLNGYPAGVTNLLPATLTHGTGTALHALIFGDWSSMIYAFWSGVDVVVDVYTAAGSGGVVITSLQDCDVNVRHPESFCKMADLISNQ